MLERVAELEDVERRRKAGKRTSGRSRADDPTVPIDTAAIEREYQRRERERQKQAARAKRDELRARAREAKESARVLREHERAVQAYMTAGGMSRAEAEAMVDREPDWSTFDYEQNPRRRRRRRNPLPPVVAEIAKDVVKGGLIAAAQEELKEWRTEAHRGGVGAIARAHGGGRRRNPARLEPNHADPKLREMSERFHGRPDQILHLDEDQRRPPPKHVVLIGQERATVYRTPRSSERAGADWEHEAGDRGMLRRNSSGRRILVADEHGRVYLLQGSSSMRFDPDQGLVG